MFPEGRFFIAVLSLFEQSPVEAFFVTLDRVFFTWERTRVDVLYGKEIPDSIPFLVDKRRRNLYDDGGRRAARNLDASAAD